MFLVSPFTIDGFSVESGEFCSLLSTFEDLKKELVYQ